MLASRAEGGVLLHRREPGPGNPDEPGDLRPFDDPGQRRQFLAGLGLKYLAADLGVDYVAGAEELYEVAGVSQSDAASLGQLATLAEPVKE
jgi:hypothetical protein